MSLSERRALHYIKHLFKSNTLIKKFEKSLLVHMCVFMYYCDHLTNLNIFTFRYYFTLVGSNGFGSQAELAVDDLSLSPQCFGLGVSTEAIGSWRYNMTDLELCQYYGN